MAIREGDIIVTTAPYVAGYRVVRVLGVALGVTVRSSQPSRWATYTSSRSGPQRSSAAEGAAAYFGWCS